MSTNVPSQEPQSITAGDSVSWLKTLADFSPPTGWLLSYVIRGPSTYRFNATNSGGDYLTYLPAATTANYSAGLYTIQAYVSNSGGYRYSVDTLFPQITIRENPATFTESTKDNRSFAARTLAACETALEALASRKVAQASVNGQSYSITDITKLIALRNRMREEVQSEQDAQNVAAGLGTQKNILVRYPGMYPVAGWPYPIRPF